MRLTGASVSLYAVSGESTRGTIAERQTKHTPKMTIVQRRYFIQSPKLLLGLRASEMLVNVKSVQRKAGIASFRVLREGSSFCAAIQAWQVAHSFRVLCGKSGKRECKSNHYWGWPILLRVLCAKGGCQIPNLKPSKPPYTREEQGIGF